MSAPRSPLERKAKWVAMEKQMGDASDRWNNPSKVSRGYGAEFRYELDWMPCRALPLLERPYSLALTRQCLRHHYSVFHLGCTERTVFLSLVNSCVFLSFRVLLMSVSHFVNERDNGLKRDTHLFLKTHREKGLCHLRLT